MADDERLEQNQCHLLGKAALHEFQFRSDNDNGTSGIVHTLTQQVLAEASLLAFEHVAQALQRPVPGSGDGTSVTPVVQQGVNCLLKHSFFIADNHLRRPELKQILQTAVTVDDTSVKIIQVGCRKASAFQRNERSQIRRNHRENFENHPFGTGSALQKAFDKTQSFGQFLADCLVFRARQQNFKFRMKRLKINLLKQRTDCRSSHFRLECVSVFISRLTVIHLIKRFTELQRRIAGVHNHPILIIDNAFKRTRRHIKHEPDTAGHALEEPDMRHRNRKFDVPHAFSSDLGLCNFDAAAVADDAFVLYPFIFTAIAFPVLLRSENPFAEETAFFRLETSVIDRLGITSGDATLMDTTSKALIPGVC